MKNKTIIKMINSMTNRMRYDIKNSMTNRMRYDIKNNMTNSMRYIIKNNMTNRMRYNIKNSLNNSRTYKMKNSLSNSMTYNMNHNLLRKIICFLLLITISLSIPSVEVSAKSSGYTVGGLEKVIDDVLAYKQKQAGVSSVQKLIDKEFAENAGKVSSMDWFMVALSRYKGNYKYSNYLKSLTSYQTAAKGIKATDLQRISLVYSASNSNAKFIKKTLNNSIGKLGIMSYIYGLILMDTRNYTSKDYTRDQIIKKILALRLADGGWALNGKASDVDVTAMTLQALAPYKNKSKVSSAINKALTMLSKRQQATGDYKSWGNRSCESTAQVIAALCELNINCQTDKRFIKKNKTLIDGLMAYHLSDGSFSHLIKGKSDNTASAQAMYSLIAVWRQKKGLSNFYSFSGSRKSGVS